MLNTFIYLIIFAFGLMVGSFLNCVIYRLEKNESFLKGRSYCPFCKHKLSWQDLIPIFSFLILRGKCRYCATKISWQYPLIEIATGIIFILCFLLAPYQALLWCGVSCFLVIIFVYDLKHFIIPDKIIYPAIVIAFLYRFFEILSFGHWNFIENWKATLWGVRLLTSREIENFTQFLNPLGAAFGGALFFLIIFFVSRGKWLGFGDVKLAFLMGLFLGFPDILVALFLSFLIGAIIGIGLILAKRKTLKSEVPFGPFLIAGTFLALFWGEKLLNFYLNLINCNSFY